MAARASLRRTRALYPDTEMTASVLDVVQFADLPIETQELCQRVYGGTPDEIDELRGALTPDDEECDGTCDVAEELRETIAEIRRIAESS